MLPLGCGPLGDELADPAHPPGGRVGVVAELLCHPAGAAADAKLLHGAADRGGEKLPELRLDRSKAEIKSCAWS